MPASNATAMPKSTAGTLSTAQADPSWSIYNRDGDSTSHMLGLKSPLTPFYNHGHYGVSTGWSPTTFAFSQRKIGASPTLSHGTNGPAVDVPSGCLHRKEASANDVHGPLSSVSARAGLAPHRKNVMSTMLDEPLTPSMYLSSSDHHPSLLGGLSLNHVLTASDAYHQEDENRAPNCSSATSAPNAGHQHGNNGIAGANWSSNGLHQYRPGSNGQSNGCLYSQVSWDANKTPTATVHGKASVPQQTWNANQIQPDLATASSRGNEARASNDRTVGNGHSVKDEASTPLAPVALHSNSNDNRDIAQYAIQSVRPGSVGKASASLSAGVTASWGKSPMTRGAAAGMSLAVSHLARVSSPLTQRPLTPRGGYALSTPTRFATACDDSLLPPLRSGGLSWYLNDWPNPLQPLKSLSTPAHALGGCGAGANGLGDLHSSLFHSNQAVTNTVVFTPGGTLKDSRCVEGVTAGVIAPTTSTAAGMGPSSQEQHGHVSPVMVGKPPLCARAPRGRPSNKPLVTYNNDCGLQPSSQPLRQSLDAGSIASSSGEGSPERRSMTLAASPMDCNRTVNNVHPMRGFATTQGGFSFALPSQEEESLCTNSQGFGNLNGKCGHGMVTKNGQNRVPLSPMQMDPYQQVERYESDSARWLAVQRRDPRASAAFFYCVLSTKIFCRTTCPSRHPVRDNIIFVETASQALSQGFRACRRCKPDLEGGDPHERRQEALIAQVKERLYASVAASGKGKTVKGQGLKYIAEDLGVSHWHLHRCFKKRVGTTPEAWAKLQAKKLRTSMGKPNRLPHLPAPGSVAPYPSTMARFSESFGQGGHKRTMSSPVSLRGITLEPRSRGSSFSSNVAHSRNIDTVMEDVTMTKPSALYGSPSNQVSGYNFTSSFSASTASTTPSYGSTSSSWSGESSSFSSHSSGSE